MGIESSVESSVEWELNSTGSKTATLVIFCACAYFTLVSNCKGCEKRCKVSLQ